MSDLEKDLLDEIDRLQDIDYVKGLGSTLGEEYDEMIGEGRKEYRRVVYSK